MKTTQTTLNLNTIVAANNFCLLITAIILAFVFTSCTSAEDEPSFTDNGAANVTEAQITFTYTVPEELFRYAEITVCYNNNEGTDAKWQPMLEKTFTVTYNLSKFPVTAPVVFVYDTTNRSAEGIDVNWDITMDVEVSMMIGGQKVTKTNFETYKIDGDLGAAISSLQRNVLDRTYAVKLTKSGDVKFVH